MKLRALAIAALLLPASAAAGTGVQPLLLQAEQGEHRTRLPLVGIKRVPAFMIKVDARNGGAQNFVMITEAFPPGARIRSHRHLHEDEILYTENGIIRARIGEREAVLGPHATLFVPHNTWVTIQNVGSQTVRLVAVFDRPGYDAYLRCSSSAAGEPDHPLTRGQDVACAKLGDVQYR